jgi:hypothetical protein
MQKIKEEPMVTIPELKTYTLYFMLKVLILRQIRVKAFRNVSVYNLIAHILGLEIEVVDGNFLEIKDMLKD